MEIKYAEKRDLLIALSLVLALSSLFICIFVPKIIQEILFAEKGVWLIQTPTIVYKLFGVAAFLWIVSFIILYFGHKIGNILAVILFLIGLMIMIFKSYHYQLMGDHNIRWCEGYTFKHYSYTWEEVSKVESVPPEKSEKNYKIKFYFYDGQSIVFIKDKKLQSKNWKIVSKLHQYNIPFTSSHFGYDSRKAIVEQHLLENSLHFKGNHNQLT
jgi:hypothetical protein